MFTLYCIIGTGAGLTALLMYLKHVLKQRDELKSNQKVLESQKDYRDEVIEELSKPVTVDDTIDSLHSGKF